RILRALSVCLSASAYHLSLLSFPTRRSSDLQIVGLLGGRVAEKLCLGDISTGASNDIQLASQIARKMVATYGMSDRIGTVSFESDRKSTRLNSSHVSISYAVFCLKKKKKTRL